MLSADPAVLLKVIGILTPEFILMTPNMLKRYLDQHPLITLEKGYSFQFLFVILSQGYISKSILRAFGQFLLVMVLLNSGDFDLLGEDETVSETTRGQGRIAAVKCSLSMRKVLVRFPEQKSKVNPEFRVPTTNRVG